MKDKKIAKFSIRERLKTFGYSFNGLKIVFGEEHNARIHLGVSIFVVIMGFIFNISSTEWLAVCILIGLVLSLEIINTAIENLCDYISPQWNEIIKKIKDLSSAAVFLAACISVTCGFIIFLPKLYNLLAQM